MPEPFDATRGFDSPSDAANYCLKQPDPTEAMKKIIIAHIDMGEFGFASECVMEIEPMQFWLQKNRKAAPQETPRTGLRLAAILTMNLQPDGMPHAEWEKKCYAAVANIGVDQMVGDWLELPNGTTYRMTFKPEAR